MKIKTVCQVCNHRDSSDNLLIALNPFDLTEPIHGCPKCKSINSYHTCCEVENCWEQDTCGTPTPDGYKRLCGLHDIQELVKNDPNFSEEKYEEWCKTFPK